MKDRQDVVQQMPDGYLLPETREGEYLDEKKKKLFKVSIDILAEIKKVCQKHKLRYFAAYGTLLGAIRHGGFIPWDDDMDIWMPREDFIKFKKVAAAELSENYFLQTTETEPEHRHDSIKIRDSRTTATLDWQIQGRKHVNMGIWVTIFPLDGCPEDDYVAEQVIGRKWFCNWLLEVAFTRVNSNLCHRVLHWIVRLAVGIVGVRRICAIRDGLGLKYPFEKSERCTSLWCLRGYNEFSCSPLAFKEFVEVPFEYTTIRVPKDYETVLKALYGDWHVCIKGTADHEYADLEPDIPYKKFVFEKYGLKL